jgi:hypothetical protein
MEHGGFRGDKLQTPWISLRFIQTTIVVICEISQNSPHEPNFFTGRFEAHGPITLIDGIDPEKHEALAKQLGVAEAALSSFFNILERNQVPPAELDHTLRIIAERYKALQADLERVSSSDPAVVALKADAKAALDNRHA